MENVKFRVVEFEESDVLTASALGTDGCSAPYKVVISSIDLNDYRGTLYQYKNGTYEVMGSYGYQSWFLTGASGIGQEDYAKITENTVIGADDFYDDYSYRTAKGLQYAGALGNAHLCN